MSMATNLSQPTVSTQPLATMESSAHQIGRREFLGVGSVILAALATGKLPKVLVSLREHVTEFTDAQRFYLSDVAARDPKWRVVPSDRQDRKRFEAKLDNGDTVVLAKEPGRFGSYLEVRVEGSCPAPTFLYRCHIRSISRQDQAVLEKLAASIKN